jgi:hypothetical protein
MPLENRQGFHPAMVITGNYCSGQEKPDHEVVVVRRTINLGTGNLEWGGNGEG